MEHATNEEVLSGVGGGRAPVFRIRERQLKYPRKLMKKKCLKNLTLTGDGKRENGKQGVEEILRSQILLIVTKNRKLW